MCRNGSECQSRMLGLRGLCRNHGGMAIKGNLGAMQVGVLLRLSGHELCWEIARDLVCRGHVKRAELQGLRGKHMQEAAEAAGLRVVVERESMGYKWVRFERCTR